MFVVAEDFNDLDYQLSISQSNIDSGTFDDFVSTNEENKLRDLLGNLFYDAFVAGLNALPSGLDLFVKGNVYNANTDYVVYLIGNVADYYQCIQQTDGSQLPTDPAYFTKQAANRWVRLKFGDAFSYNSIPEKWYGMKRLVQPMIYSLWLSKIFKITTSQGVVQTQNENSDTVSPIDRINKGWNDYARFAGGEYRALPDWRIYWGTKNTLFAYLSLTSTNFDDLVSQTTLSSFNAYLMQAFKWPGRQNFLDL